MIIGVTGHRPHLLGGYGEDVFQNLVRLFENYITDKQPTKVYTGMALGWDQAVALACLKHAVPYVAVIPFPTQAMKWPDKAQQRWRYLCGEASETIIISSRYTGYAMIARNRYIVEACDRLCALYSGAAGGTRHCVEYAEKQGKSIDNLWDKTTLFR